jgi:hypothetical protein
MPTGPSALLATDRVTGNRALGYADRIRDDRVDQKKSAEHDQEDEEAGQELSNYVSTR